MLHMKSSFCVYRKYGKRLIDIILSFAGLVLLAPFLFVITVWVKLDSKGPALFRQKRVGRHKTYFFIMKFRTMIIDTPKDVPTHLLNDPHAHITRCGRFLRKTSLDELPQLWNIFVGHMSIIGPRPALWNQEDLIAERDRYRANDMRPGLTGWAQINGRDELEIEEKAKLDGDYIKNISFRMDFICFFSTIATVLRSKGIIEGGTGILKAQKNIVDEKVVTNR